MTMKTSYRGGCGCASTPCSCMHKACDPCGAGATAVTCADALPGGLTRTRFYDGMLLTQADLGTEQRFWRMKRRLTNRALGRGVVWGLRAGFDARRGAFHIGPGYALDCCGNDLVVECPVQASASKLVTDELRRELSTAETRVAQLVLEYAECPEDPRAVHTDGCTTDATRCEHARVRESARLRLALPPEPEACALDSFREELDALRTACPDLFPFDDRDDRADDVEVEFSPSDEPEVAAALEVRMLGSQQVATLEPQGGEWSGTTDPIARVASNASSVRVSFTLSPAAGWLLTRGEARLAPGDDVGGGQGALLGQVDPPYDVALGWTWTLANLPTSGSQTYSLRARVHDWQLSPWRERGRAVEGDTMFIDATATATAGHGQVTVALDAVTIRAGAAQFASTSRDCFDHLRPGLIWRESPTGDWISDPKAIALAALHGWLAHATPDDGSDEWPARRVAAAWLYIVAWRLLFGADATLPDANRPASCSKQRLADIVHNLFRRWCDGFVYTGPRCTGTHHGAVLGTVVLDPKSWRPVRFDPNEGRRHVLTGPLLSHWMCQVGLASVDVVASRLAQFVCCVAGLPRPTLPDLPQKGVVDAQDSGNGVELSTNTAGAAAVGLTNSNYFAYGNPEHTRTALGLLNAAPSLGENSRGGFDLLGLALSALTRSHAPEGSISYRSNVHHRMGASGIQIMPGQTSIFHPQLDRFVHEVAALPALARRPIADAAAETVDALPIATLPDADAVAGIGIDTVGALLRADPEAVSDRVWSTLDPATRDETAHAAHMAAVFASAEARANDVATAWAGAAADASEPVLRATITNDALLDAVATRANVDRSVLASAATRAIRRGINVE